MRLLWKRASVTDLEGQGCCRYARAILKTKKLREIVVGGLFRWVKPEPGEVGAVYRVTGGAEPGKGRVTAEAINTGMVLAPYSVYSGDEEVEEILKNV